MPARPPSPDVTHRAPRLSAGQLVDWLEDATFLFMFFSGASLIVTILMLLIVL